MNSDSGYSGHRTTSIKDQLGRKIVIEYNSATDQDSIHTSGVGGVDVVTKVIWKNIEVNKTYFSCDIDYPGSGGVPDLQNFPLDESLRVVDKINLPSQLGDPSTDDIYYTFSYNADNSSASDTGWGEVNRVDLPAKAYSTSEARADYDYYYDSASGSSVHPEDILLNRPVRKDLVHDTKYDGTVSSQTDTWLYTVTAAYGVLQNLSAVTVTGPDGGNYVENYAVDSNEAPPTIPAHRKGEMYKSVGADGTIVERFYTSNAPLIAGFVISNRFVKYEFMSPQDASGNYTKTAIKEFRYDKNGNVTEVREYDFVAYSTVPRNTNGEPYALPSGATPARITKTEFYNDTPDSASSTYNDPDSYWLASSQRLRNLVRSVEVQDASSTPKSRTEITYDYTSYSSNTVGGNLVETRVWDSFKGGSAQGYSNPLTSTNSITTSATYNNYGMPLTTTDANGNVTQITYGNVAGPSGNVTDLYPTQTVAAYGTSLARTSSAVYDFYTGLVTSATDVDNGVTNSTEYDDLGRPVKAITAVGTSLESWSVTEYHDADRFVVVRSDLETKGDGKKVATQFFDQLGRVRLSKMLEDAATQSATNETDGIKVQTRYLASGICTFDATKSCSSQLASNPYRADYSYNAGSESTMGWTLSQSRADGRHSEVETFGGAALPKPFVASGQNTNSTGAVRTETDANATTVTDQAGKQRRSITNALGLLTRVDEPTSGGLGTVASPNQPTNYFYNTLGKMVRVQQGAQDRYFLYDSLGRMIRVRQPEQEVNTALNTTGNPDNNSWSVGSTFDANGNVLTTTDAKGTTITNTYDALNRIVSRTYSDGTTPAVNYSYDGAGMSPAVPNSKGKLTKVTNGISETTYTNFDVAGRLLSSTQRTPLDGETISHAIPRTSSYQYNLAGALVEQTYPSGRVVKEEYDASGDIARIYGNPTSTAAEQTYATSFAYTPDGKIEKLKLGNGLWEAAKLNSRLQVKELALGYSAGDGSLLKLNYEYGELQTNGSVDATKNAGNIAKQTVSFSGLANPFVQTYKYDPLDRISEAKETVNGTQTWKQTFGYDIYGNRTSFYQIVAAQELAMNNLTLPTVQSTRNRFSDSQGYTYDANGNIIADPQDGGRSFTFNGDNKQVEVKNSQNVTLGRYYYDGDGRRVKKVTDLETTVFIYDGSGKLVAEYSNAAPPADPTIRYTATDQLGSPRVVTDKFGQIISRRDFMPFGEELSPDGTYRTTDQKYGVDDNVRQKFTGYQRDIETDLDFAEARYYNNGHGRFTAVDPLLASGKSADPQTFNRYVYVVNNPLTLTDPTGLQAATKPDDQPQLTPAEIIRRFTPIWIDVPYEKTVLEGPGVVDEVMTHVTSAIATFAENNGSDLIFGPTQVEHTSVGRLLGNTASIIQGVSEIVTGSTMTGGGGIATTVTAPACSTGVGCAVPATTGTISVTGAAVATHGTAVIANTLYNVATKETNPFKGPVSKDVTVVDGSGNAIPVKAGEQLGGSPDGKYIQVKDSNGVPTGIRKDGGHNPITHTDPRAQKPHGHRPGVTNEDGTSWLPINR